MDWLQRFVNGCRAFRCLFSVKHISYVFLLTHTCHSHLSLSLHQPVNPILCSHTNTVQPHSFLTVLIFFCVLQPHSPPPPIRAGRLFPRHCTLFGALPGGPVCPPEGSNLQPRRPGGGGMQLLHLCPRSGTDSPFDPSTTPPGCGPHPPPNSGANRTCKYYTSLPRGYPSGGILFIL